MIRLMIAALLLTPLTVLAATPCKYSAPRHLQLDLAGVRAVQIDVRSYDLHVNGTPGARQLVLDGRACASGKDALDHLQVSQRREGDQLILELGGQRGSGFSFNLFGSSYATLDVNVQLPPTMPVTVRVGSGDATVTGMQQLDSTVGSGDLDASHVTGVFSTTVGSGNVNADTIGSLQGGAVGSGDLVAKNIKGDAKVGAIGSGDVRLTGVGGSVRVDTIGSGDLTVRDVGGALDVGAKGSGDVDYANVRGKVSVPHADD